MKLLLFLGLLLAPLHSVNSEDNGLVVVESADDCPPFKSFQCRSGEPRCIPFEKYCNNISDCSDGSDETVYNPLTQSVGDGIQCLKLYRDVETREAQEKTCLLPQRYVGDFEVQCELGEDECGFPHAFKCHTSPIPDIIEHQCALRRQFCDGVPECYDLADETEFRPGVEGFKCPVAKLHLHYSCALPTTFVCDGFADCDFGTDECFCDPLTGEAITDSYSNDRCFRCLDGFSVIPNRDLCDGKFHCTDLSDECMCNMKPAICEEICTVGVDCKSCDIGQIMCASNGENSSPKCINVTQVCNGVFDCPLKEDEVACKVVEADTFTCADQSMYIPIQQRCDNIADCRDGSDEANCSALFFECYETSVYKNLVMGHENQYEVFRPRFTKSCDLLPLCEDFEDECNVSLCGEELPPYCGFIEGKRGFVCPESGFQLFGSDICDGFPSCSANAPEKSTDELFCPNRFYCADRGKERVPIHISNSARCDAISDCFDQSDELNCSLETHFYCKSGAVRYVPRTKVCDGIQDCADGEDECQQCSDSPFSTDEFLINSYVLQVFIWIIGILSVIGNVTVLLHSFSMFWRSGKSINRISYNHRILVTNLATADLLLGIYLISLSVVNSRYEDIYCRRDIQWRASTSCVAMGTMAVISTECCIFLLVTMATMRLSLVTRPFYSTIKRRYVMLGIAASWILAFTIALVPLASSQMDYFVSLVWYPNNPFLRLAHRQEVQDIATYIWSLSESGNHPIQNITSDRSLTWGNMIETIQILNETYQPTLYFGYYSTHGVCLPRLFPDPLQDQSWGFSLAVITLNFVAFIYMLVAYIIIYRVTAMQTRDAGRSDADAATTDLQRKITRIIFTNFCCWIPICILAFISAAGYYLSSEIYAVSAIILLPINSAFNPLLYSDLPDFIWKKVFENTKFGRWVRRKKLERNSTRRNTINTYTVKQYKKAGGPTSSSNVTEDTKL